MSGPIFGNSSALGGSGGNRHLGKYFFISNLKKKIRLEQPFLFFIPVEFRAGRMNMVGKMVHPDTRKGLVYVYQAEDGLIHFCWKDRTTGNVEDDLIIFPDDCEFKKVEACKTGRVYLLKFKSSSRKLFFWMQESKNDKDDEWTRRVNEVMNNPPSMSSSGSGRGGGSGSTGDNGDLQYMLNNMSQQQLMQLFGGVGQMGGLSSLLGSINRPSSGTNSTTKTTAAVTPSRTTTTASATPVTVTTPSNSSAAPSTPQAPKKTTTGGNSSSQEATTPAASGTTDTSRVLLSELQNYLSGLTTGNFFGFFPLIYF